MSKPSVSFLDSLGAEWRFERSVDRDGAGIVVYVRPPSGGQRIVVIPEPDIDEFVDALKAATRLPRVLKTGG